MSSVVEEAAYVCEVCRPCREDSAANPAADSNKGAADALERPTTLVVLLHGLRGNHRDYDACVGELRRSAQRPMLVCRPTCNDGKGLWAHTAKGTVQAATRAFDTVSDMLRDLSLIHI